MKLSPINTHQSPSFASVKSIGNYTEKQLELNHGFKSILKEPYKGLKNKTPEQYYGSKGYDLVLEPISNDKIKLSLKKDFKIIRTGPERTYNWSEAIYLNEYDDNNPLNVEDIINVYKTQKGNKHTLIGILGSAVLVLALIGLSQYKGAKTAYMPVAEKIANTVDSIYNKIITTIK